MKKRKQDDTAAAVSQKRERTEPVDQGSQPEIKLTPQDLKNQTFNLLPDKELPTPRKHTVSIAITASFIEQFEKAELRTYAAGQIGRALALFCVDEVIVFPEAQAGTGKTQKTTDGTFESASKKKIDGVMFLARILQYLETPSYLRKALFPVHRDLKFAGLMNPLEAPHHMRYEDYSLFREGVTTEKRYKQGCLVDCGLEREVYIERAIKPRVRVTVQLDDPSGESQEKYLKGTIVSPSLPREKYGIYWGFKTRVAPTISKVISECPYAEGYDLTIGDLAEKKNTFKDYKHLLIVLGGSRGIEYLPLREHIAYDFKREVV
ncbi:putative RNA methyltransferase-domain-containing protein [Chytridium lagenaria]|nr:putative RNA methyltransferase-domain-containing protein [Chytridium lagenaria]